LHEAKSQGWATREVSSDRGAPTRQETYKKEEQRRFEILDAHWDLPIKDVDLEAR